MPDKYQEVHCPACGGTDTNLTSSVGRFLGNAGGSINGFACRSCNSTFNLLITGDEMFPERGYPANQNDFDILFKKTA